MPNEARARAPRTANCGYKLRVRSNAVQHGLATTALRHPALAIDIQRMAKAICAESKSRLQFDQALSIAESELMLTKVRSTLFGALRVVIFGRTNPTHPADAAMRACASGSVSTVPISTPTSKGGRGD